MIKILFTIFKTSNDDNSTNLVGNIKSRYDLHLYPDLDDE